MDRRDERKRIKHNERKRGRIDCANASSLFHFLCQLDEESILFPIALSLLPVLISFYGNT